MGKKESIKIIVGDREVEYYGDLRILNFIIDTIEIMSKKNKDYTAVDEDNFATFRRYEIAGITAEQGIMARMIDKLSRISNLINGRSPGAVVDESVRDTLRDMIAYSAILAVLVEEDFGGDMNEDSKGSE